MSIWQTKQWQEMLKKSGQVSEFFEINNIFVEKRQVAMGEYGLFVLGLGKEVDELKLIELCKKENCLFIQIETLDYGPFSIQIKNPLSISPNGREEASGFDNFKKGYYKKFITPYTSVINLKQTEEEILAKMKPKGRYNIKLATKKGVEVKEVEKTEANIKKYYDLMLETTSRDSFSGNSMEYYIIFLKELKNSKLLLAYVEEKVIAGGIFTFDKEVSIYYYGASTSDKKYRNLMAPYLLQWEAIKIAKEYGSQLYDFLGVATPGDKNSSLAGVTSFKLKLSCDTRLISNSYIYINKIIKFYFIQLLRKFKK